MYKFSVLKNNKKIGGQLIYSTKDQSFQSLPLMGGGLCLLLGYLQLVFDPFTMCAIETWGLSGVISWKNKPIKTPLYSAGQLKLLANIDDFMLERGYRLEYISYTPTYNPATGWLCYGDYNVDTQDEAVEFATNIVAVVNNEKLKSIWLKPDFVD